MAKRLTVAIRVVPELKDLLRDITYERFKLGKDKVPLKTPRLSMAITRIPKIKELMVNSEIKN